MNNIINFYIKYSKHYVILCMYLGILELINTPLKLWKMIIPIAVYSAGMHYRDKLEIPMIPESAYSIVDKVECIVLTLLLLIVMIVVVIKIGRDLYATETDDLRLAIAEEDDDNKKYVHLVYKRKKDGYIVRKIYSKTVAKKWRKNEVREKIRKNFSEHFGRGICIYDDPKCPSLTVMITEKGYEEDTETGEKYHDDELNKEMEEIE